jgi:hypothetical protein
MFTRADVAAVKKDLPKTCDLFEKMYEKHEQHQARMISASRGLIESGRVTEDMLASLTVDASLGACIISQLEHHGIPWNFRVLGDLAFYMVIQSCALAKEAGEEIPDVVKREQVAFLSSYTPSLRDLFTPQTPTE